VKFLDGLTKHRFHIWGVGFSYAHMIGWVIGFYIVSTWF